MRSSTPPWSGSTGTTTAGSWNRSARSTGGVRGRLPPKGGSQPHRRTQGPKPPVNPGRFRVDPEEVFGEVKRRALTPEEAGRLLACFPLFWWDHMVTLLGTGLRFGELAGLRRRRVHLGRELPVLEVGPTRYEAGRFGSGFKP